MFLLALVTLTFAGRSNFVTSGRVLDIDDADLSFENDINEMEFAMNAMKEDAVENIGDLTADDVENINDITVDGEKDSTNMTEVLRRRFFWPWIMRWKQCAVYKGTASPAQYLYLHGQCRHIQSWGTIRNWYGRNVYRTISQSVMNSCRKGAPIRPGAYLARGDRSHPVYAIYNGRKHHIVSARTMSRCRFNWGKVRVVRQRDVDRIRTGRSISA